MSSKNCIMKEQIQQLIFDAQIRLNKLQVKQELQDSQVNTFILLESKAVQTINSVGDLQTEVTQTPSYKESQFLQTDNINITESTTITKFEDLYPQFSRTRASQEELDFLKTTQIQNQMLQSMKQSQNLWNLQSVVDKGKSSFVVDGVRLPQYRRLSQSSFK